MPGHESISAYLDAVSDQIRWGRARRLVIPELRQHLEDQRDAFLAEGIGDAERRAVEEMGDPVAVGAELDRIHRPKPQWALLALTAALALAGMLLRIWVAADSDSTGRAALSFALGCAALLAGYFLDVSFLSRRPRAVCAALLAAALAALPLIHRPGAFSPFQLSHLCLFLPAAYACWLYSCRGRGWPGLLAALAGAVPVLALTCAGWYRMALIPTLLTCLILPLDACRRDWFGAGRLRSALAVCGCAAAGITAVACTSSGWFHAAFRRLAAAISPEHAAGVGYQSARIRESLDASRWWGQGVWTGAEPYETAVPSWDSDNLLTTLIYRLGWLPFLILILAFAALMIWLLYRGLRQRGQMGRFLVVTTVIVLGAQALFNLLWSLGVTWHSTFFPLLTGNSSTVIDMALIGLSLSALRGDSIACEKMPLQKLPRYKIRVVIERS